MRGQGVLDCLTFASWGTRRPSARSILHQPLCRLLSTQATNAPKPHYTTTPIFYVNSGPHIGHLHSIVLADVFSRWAGWRNKGWSEPPVASKFESTERTMPILATGTDEHGIKIQKTADVKGTSPEELCDRFSMQFKKLADEAGAQYTRFVRTTDKDHIEAVNELWNQLERRGYIYKGTHEGWYAESDETFYPASQVIPVKEGEKLMKSAETGSLVEWSSEDNYKFKLSEFQQPLLDWLKANPDAILPHSRRDSLIKELKLGLEDLSVSRPRTRLQWGIPVPSDKEHTIYVWLDALTNYLTVAGYPWKDNTTRGCWPSDVQIIGKDIIRFHAIYFPAMLMALDLPLPKHFITHGHWTVQKEKMSKSRDNGIDPFTSIKKFGRDEVRWFLCRLGGNLEADPDWNEDNLLSQRKSLAGKWGNLVSRTMAPPMLNRIFKEEQESMKLLKDKIDFRNGDLVLLEALEKLPQQYDAFMSRFEVNRALGLVSKVVSHCNRHISNLEPWKWDTSAKRGVYLSLETCRITALLAQSVLPNKMKQVLRTIQVDSAEQEWSDAIRLRDSISLTRPKGKPKPTFLRIASKDVLSQKIRDEERSKKQTDVTL